MKKCDFVAAVQKILGPDIDPWALKRKLEEGGPGVEGLGHMSLNDTLIFIRGFQRAHEAFQLIREEQFSDVTADSTSLTIDGMYELHNRHRFRPVENSVRNTERK